MKVFVLTLALGTCALTARAERNPAPSAQAAPDAQKQLDEILSKPSYHRWERRFAQERPEQPEREEQPPGWLSAAWEKFTAWLNRRSIPDDAPSKSTHSSSSASDGASWFAAGPILKTVFWVVLAAAVVLIGWFIVRALMDAKGRGTKIKVKPGAEKIREALASGAALALDGQEWLEEADQLVASGNFRAAYRALYLALLSGLHASGAIHFRRSRTNWTYVRDFKGEVQDRGSFEQLTGLFDAVWYGLQIPEDAPGRLPALQGEVARLIHAPEAAHA